MKMKKIINLIDPITYIAIWTPDEKEEPTWEGYLLDMPWYFLDYEIAFDPNDEDAKYEEPIFIGNVKERNEPVMTINLREVN